MERFHRRLISASYTAVLPILGCKQKTEDLKRYKGLDTNRKIASGWFGGTVSAQLIND